MKTYNQFINEYLEELSDDELLEMWNNYCKREKNHKTIYLNDDAFMDEYFSDLNNGIKVDNNYRPNHKYVIVNNNMVKSFYYADLEDYLNIEELAKYLEKYDFLKRQYNYYI